MTVLALGLNHGSAPLDLRGRFAIPAEALGRSIQGLRDHLSQARAEVAILSTCNRTEVYVGLPASGCPRHALGLVEPAMEWLARQGETAPGELRQHSYCREGVEAARHAFRVAAGLDSMVLGEPQILGQMKVAVREAGTAGTLGTTLHQMFQRSFAVAKEVRSRTEIGSHAVSLAAAAVRLAQQLFDDLPQRRVLFIGAGEMIELVATHFAAQKPLRMTVANRSAERGQALAQRLGADQLPLSALGEALGHFDIVISCTASSLPLIGLGAVERAVRQRKRRPMLMLDLAVPRDIEPEVARLDDVYLYTVDDLARQVQVNGERRQAAVAQAEAIVSAGVDSFSQWLEQRAAVPVIQALQRQIEDWRQAELLKARRSLARGQDVDAVMESLSAALTRKMLHGALSELHGSAGEAQQQWVSSVQRLFLRSGP
ncbi:glutamyl-tRNA reductase [Roseateles sp. SL47]|uniref:glutamyl-tRNA reductase n=1 Tax=Roseateles sp. SL47 TaxID=2995138 RepID=UPI0022705E3C|nr:glutamyl-tRNA reductase [Roseateles sp. SL47]WAC73200.1 glutamyl-tRNA reductase [Roseateles sp. SL47]